MLGLDDIKKLSENYPLLGILIGITLVSLSIGPFQNGDSDWQFAAAKGVLNWGMPYVNTFGNIINQAPLGFYIEALFFKIVGLSIINGTALITLFGLGSIIVIYKIGKELYDKPTGLIATVLFALSPWELVLSRIFFIDAQSLFLSLLCLYLGILAIRKGSIKISMLSGVFFAAAFLTKYFAAFILIPLILLWLYSRPKNAKLFFSQVVVFLLPVLLFSFLWYQIVLGKELLYIFHHSDLSDLNYSGVTLSYSFVGVFLWNYGLGSYFIAAIAFSLSLLAGFKNILKKPLRLDIICLATILPIIILDMILGVGLNLKAPYNNAITYDYLALPFFCLVAASLLGKCISLANLAKLKTNIKWQFVLAAIVTTGVLLLASSIFASMNMAHQLSTTGYLLYRVTMDQDVGYTILNPAVISQNSFLMNSQYLGFAILLSGLLWAGRHKLVQAFKPMKQSINEKRALSYAKENP